VAASPGPVQRDRDAWRARTIVVLLILAAVAGSGGMWRTLVYVHETTSWTTAHGLMLGHSLGGVAGDDEIALDDEVVRDDFSVDHGSISLCHWDDLYAAWLPAIGHVRAVARARHWRPGIRVRLKLDPTQPGVCRPAYGWAEYVRLELTGYVLLMLLFGCGALFIRLAPRS